MKSQNNIKCPECGQTTCVYGTIDNSDTDYNDVHFIPNVSQKSFWKFINKNISLSNKCSITACYSCGYMWGRLDSDNLKNVLGKLEWKGELQTEQRTINLPIIVERFMISVVICLFLFILFLYIKI